VNETAATRKLFPGSRRSGGQTSSDAEVLSFWRAQRRLDNVRMGSSDQQPLEGFLGRAVETRRPAPPPRAIAWATCRQPASDPNPHVTGELSARV